MTIQRLRAIAVFHRQRADQCNADAEESRKANCPNVAAEERKIADFHNAVARDLTELANAFETLTPLLTSQK